VGLRSDATQPLEEIQGDPLCFKNAGNVPCHSGHSAAQLDSGTILQESLKAQLRVNPKENLPGYFYTGQNAFLFDHDKASPLLLAGYQRLGGNVTLSNILGQGALDNTFNLDSD
jgi:hypothetical protein